MGLEKWTYADQEDGFDFLRHGLRNVWLLLTWGSYYNC